MQVAAQASSSPGRFVASGSEIEPLCPLCGAAAGRVRYRYEDYQIISCEGCGLWRACPRLSPAQLEHYYEQEYYSEKRAREGEYEAWHAANRAVWRRSAQLVLEEARRTGLEARQTRLLDVGCGQGFFMQECAQLGMQVRGIEPSPHAVSYARETLELDVREGVPESLETGERYHVITMWEVLEHVPQPLQTLRGLHGHLEEGGMLWVTVPNINALQRRIQGGRYFNLLNKSHLTHFDRKTLRRMLERAGFSAVRRIVHFGGGGRSGLAAIAQYAARGLGLGTDLRFLAVK